MFSKLCRVLAVAALFACRIACAQDTDQAQDINAFVAGLHFQTGAVNVAGGHATLNLTPEFRYLDARDAQSVLEELWGNPPDIDVLGMIVPSAVSLAQDNAWAVVVTYSNDGHVSDSDAAKLDYAQMLKDMQRDTHEANADRAKQGYPKIELVGWAAPPHYDAVANKLYWAKELDAEGAHEHTLNYDIRALGRGGYLSLNAVAGISQLALVQSEMQKVLEMTQFDAGQRYGDFNASTDKVAAYGVGALVAGALAAKAGLFAKLLAMLLAFKKIVIAGFIAVAAAVRKFFGGKAAK